jgi:hypothetical protein
MQLAEELSAFGEKEANRPVPPPRKQCSMLEDAAKLEAAAARLDSEGCVLGARAARAQARGLRLLATLDKAAVVVAFRDAIAKNACACSQTAASSSSLDMQLLTLACTHAGSLTPSASCMWPA